MTEPAGTAALRAAVRDLVAARVSREIAARLLPDCGDGDPAAACAAAAALPAGAPWAELAARYPALLAPDQRKRHGAWFTPMTLARPTAARALAPLLASGPRPLAIVDPAAGGGTFLLAAFAELRAHGWSATGALRGLYGVDTDPVAAALAALSLWQATELPAAELTDLAERVRAGDGLGDHELPAGAFDAVLTNPPWETLQASASAAADAARHRPRFRHRGRGKVYTYRLFVELTHELLRPGGRFGLLVPASLWFDRDAAPLRELLLQRCDWEWLFGFENRRKLFPIDGRYRFAAIVGGKGGTTSAVRVAFGRTDAGDWATAAPAHVLYPATQVARLSPRARTFVEVEHGRDLDLLLRLQEHGVPLLGDGGFAWRQGDFNMTSDRGRFVSRADAEARGWRRGDDCVWRRVPGDEELLPLYQGAMVYDLHPNVAAHAGGSGFATRWQEPAAIDDLRPAYLVRAADWRAGAAGGFGGKVVLRALSNATNERTAVAGLLPDQPCGNSLGVLVPGSACARPLCAMAAAAGALASLAFDWALRLRLTGQNVNGFVLADCRLPRVLAEREVELAQCALRLAAVLPWHGGLWQMARREGWAPAAGPAVLDAERRALHTRLDLLAGRAFGLAADDVAWIVRGCDLPADRLRRRPPPACHSKGFWRIDRGLPPAERRPDRWLAAARAVERPAAGCHTACAE